MVGDGEVEGSQQPPGRCCRSVLLLLLPGGIARDARVWYHGRGLDVGVKGWAQCGEPKFNSCASRGVTRLGGTCLPPAHQHHSTWCSRKRTSAVCSNLPGFFLAFFTWNRTQKKKKKKESLVAVCYNFLYVLWHTWCNLGILCHNKIGQRGTFKIHFNAFKKLLRKVFGQKHCIRQWYTCLLEFRISAVCCRISFVISITIIRSLGYNFLPFIIIIIK